MVNPIIATIQKLLDFSANHPVVSVALVSLSLFAYVIYAATTFKPLDGPSFIIFSVLCIVIILAALAIVKIVVSSWQRK